MAFYKGENKAYSITIKDSDGAIISTDDILDIVVRLYNEYNKKTWLTYRVGGGLDPEDRTLAIKTDKTGYEFELNISDTSVADRGRYISEVIYKTYDTRFNNNEKVDIVRGALITIKD